MAFGTLYQKPFTILEAPDNGDEKAQPLPSPLWLTWLFPGFHVPTFRLPSPETFPFATPAAAADDDNDTCPWNPLTMSEAPDKGVVKVRDAVLPPWMAIPLLLLFLFHLFG